MHKDGLCGGRCLVAYTDAELMRARMQIQVAATMSEGWRMARMLMLILALRSMLILLVDLVNDVGMFLDIDNNISMWLQKSHELFLFLTLTPYIIWMFP